MLCSISYLIVWHNTPHACMITHDSHDFESSYVLEINFSEARLPGEILNFNLSMHEAKTG